jgi:hypothetical protein
MITTIATETHKSSQFGLVLLYGKCRKRARACHSNHGASSGFESMATIGQECREVSKPGSEARSKASRPGQPGRQQPQGRVAVPRTNQASKRPQIVLFHLLVRLGMLVCAACGFATTERSDGGGRSSLWRGRGLFSPLHPLHPRSFDGWLDKAGRHSCFHSITPPLTLLTPPRTTQSTPPHLHHHHVGCRCCCPWHGRGRHRDQEARAQGKRDLQPEARGGGIVLSPPASLPCTYSATPSSLSTQQVPLAAKLVVGAVAGVVGTVCIFPIGTCGGRDETEERGMGGG